MNQSKVTVTPDTLRKARTEADKLARLLHEEVPDGDEIKDALYRVGMTIKQALPEIRQEETKRSHWTEKRVGEDCAGIG